MLKSQTLIDRLSAYELLRTRANGREIKKMHGDCHFKNLLEINEIINKSQVTLLEIYPTKSADFNITNFNTYDIERNLKDLYECCKCRFWWVDGH